ncbi:MAG: Cof-type HAD-IIB family hydrolase [Clostridiales bacterium]|jgi:Cof subfamily protein (haloacid dehalogenase superfamily)|nr:Cof-type HAD-IIB family hydrolase [Clostridiales bacterium]
MKYKMLVSDLDGTILSGASKVTFEAKRAVEILDKKGVRFVLCSGRCMVTMRPFENELNLCRPDQYSIAFNGGMIYETGSGKRLSDIRLPRDLSMEILRVLRRLGADATVYIGDKLFVERNSIRQDPKDMNKLVGLPEGIEVYTKSTGMPITLVDDFDDLDEDFSKILVSGDSDKLKVLDIETADLAGGRCGKFFSSNWLLEYCPINAHKGLGVATLCERLGIAQSEVVAMGDYSNDVTMLKMAGIGVAVANANPDAKAVADYITKASNDENAILEVIHRFF